MYSRLIFPEFPHNFPKVELKKYRSHPPPPPLKKIPFWGLKGHIQLQNLPTIGNIFPSMLPNLGKFTGISQSGNPNLYLCGADHPSLDQFATTLACLANDECSNESAGL